MTVVSPVVLAPTLSLDSYFVKDSYKGIATDIKVNNLTDATSLTVEVTRSTGASITKTAKDSVLTALSSGAVVSRTAPIVIQSGSYSESSSGSWNMPSSSSWTSATVPTSLTVTITRTSGPNLVESVSITPTMGPFATLAEVMPVAPVCTYDFQSLKMWEVTWGWGFADRNGNAPKFTPQSNGGLETINGAPTTWNDYHLYVTDRGATQNTSYQNTYGFADGTFRTVNISWNDVNGCQIPTIVWNTIGLDTAGPEVDNVVLNGKNVAVAREDNCGPTDFNLVSGKITLNADISDNLSGVKNAKYKIRKVTDGGCTQTGIYQSSSVSMDKQLGNSWVTLAGSELDTTDTPTDGTYTIQMTVTDNAGNAATNYIDIRVDNTAPTKPTITTPTARQWFKAGPITNSWSAASDPSGIAKYQIAYNYDDGHSFGGANTCPGVTIAGASGFIGCRDVNGLTRSHGPGANEQGGVTIWVRAVDNAGNVGPWSQSVHYYYDHEDPTTTINAPTGLVGNTFTVSGDAEDNQGLNRVYVQLNKREGGRFGGTTISMITTPFSTTNSWSKTFNATALGLADGDYRAHVSVVDMAGNSSSAGWTDYFTVDSTAPTTTVSVNDTANPTIATVTISDDNPQGKYVVNAYHVSDSSKNARVCGLVEFAVGETSATCNITGLADGEYYLKANVLDEVGNNSAFSPDQTSGPTGRGAYSEHFVVDTTAPTVNIPTYTTLGNVITPNVTATDDNGPLNYSWDDNEPNVELSASNVAAPQFTVNVDGAYSFVLTVTDAFDNATLKTFSFTYATPPATPGLLPTGGAEETTQPIEQIDDAPIPAIGNGFTNVVVIDSTPDADSSAEAVERGEVLGTETSDTPLEQSAALATSNQGWKLWGVAWYWFALAMAALAALWWMIAALRRRQQAQADEF